MNTVFVGDLPDCFFAGDLNTRLLEGFDCGWFIDAHGCAGLSERLLSKAALLSLKCRVSAVIAAALGRGRCSGCNDKQFIR